MALRLTGPSLSPDGPPEPAALGAQAAVALASGDLRAYRELFDTAAGTTIVTAATARAALLLQPR